MMLFRRNALLTPICSGLLVAMYLAAPVEAQRRARIPRPEPVELTTKDGVKLVATYYGSAVPKAPPVILLHDHKESRVTFSALAKELQNPRVDEEGGEEAAAEPRGFAVLAVDLRGHGDSTKQFNQFGDSRELDANKLKLPDFEQMVMGDMEQVRKFLVGKNDEGEINLNQLSLVGVGTGASVATLWAAADWSAPPLAVGKQGQDVKALVLVSPRWKNRGLLLQPALRQPGVQREVAMLMLYGKENSRVKADANRIHSQLKRYHPEPSSSAEKESHDLVALAWPTSLQGSKLLKEIGRPATKRIVDFLSMHAADEQYSWTKRRTL